jgi:hypothetical protein
MALPRMYLVQVSGKRETQNGISVTVIKTTNYVMTWNNPTS